MLTQDHAPTIGLLQRAANPDLLPSPTHNNYCMLRESVSPRQTSHEGNDRASGGILFVNACQFETTIQPATTSFEQTTGRDYQELILRSPRLLDLHNTSWSSAHDPAQRPGYTVDGGHLAL